MKVRERAPFGEGDTELELQVLEQHYYGRRTVTLQVNGPYDLDAVIDRIGKAPLPPISSVLPPILTANGIKRSLQRSVIRLRIRLQVCILRRS